MSRVCREGNEPGDQLSVTYRELLQRVCRFANVLKAQGAFTVLLPPAGQLPYCRSHTSPPLLLRVRRREEGRPRVHLHAHGGGAGGGHVGVRARRRRSLHRGEFRRVGAKDRGLLTTALQNANCC